MFAVTTLCRVSLAICPRFYHEAWWGGLVSSLVMKLLKWNFLFFTNFVKIFCDTTQPHSTTCTDGTRSSPSWLICPGYICSTNCCGSTNPLPVQLKWGTLISSSVRLLSFHFIGANVQCLVINIITFSSVCQAFWSNNIFSRFWELLKYWNIQYSRLALIFHF